MLEGYWKRLLALLAHIGLYARALAKWLLLAAVTGCCCGVVGALFHIGVHEATALREDHPWLLWCLPLAGLAIVGLYKLTKTEGRAPMTSSTPSTMERACGSGCYPPSSSARC